MNLLKSLARLWSTTRFPARDLSTYAERRMVDETRRGVQTMSLVCLAVLLGTATVHTELGLERSYLYTSLALAALCLHVRLSARALYDIKALHALGMTLLIISGTAFVLLAHQTGAFGAVLLTSAALLLMVVPMVPWGLREASIVILLIYALFSSSTWSVPHHFDRETLSALQALMLAAGLVSATLVARGARVRKADLESRFALERAHREMEQLSYRDPLTRAWNRRFLEREFEGFAESARKSGGSFHFALIDLDHFKKINDTRGHAFGDRVLQWVAVAFQRALGEGGYLIRTGGDEFALLLQADDPEVAIGEAITDLGARGIEENLHISVSGGLVAVPAGMPVTLDDAYRAADSALYRAKRSGEGGSPGSLRLVGVVLEPGGPAGSGGAA